MVRHLASRCFVVAMCFCLVETVVVDWQCLLVHAHLSVSQSPVELWPVMPIVVVVVVIWSLVGHLGRSRLAGTVLVLLVDLLMQIGEVAPGPMVSVLQVLCLPSLLDWFPWLLRYLPLRRAPAVPSTLWDQSLSVALCGLLTVGC